MITGESVRQERDRSRAPPMPTATGDKVARGARPERKRQKHAGHRGDDGDLQALGHAAAEQLELVGAKFGGNIRAMKRAPCPKPTTKRSQVDVEDRARVDDVERRARCQRDPRRPVRRKGDASDTRRAEETRSGGRAARCVSSSSQPSPP